MSANVIESPADRCRRPATAIEVAERAAYDRAANDHAAYGWHGPSVYAMMTLAMEGACAAAGAKAAAWLHEHHDILVR